MDALRETAKPDPYSLPCAGCERDVGSVEGPSYPTDLGILCADCGLKVEAAHLNKAITDRDGGPT